MASKDGGFSLTQRQEARYNRYEKQLASILEKHLAKVKQIDQEWATFKEQNSKAYKLYTKTEEARSKDPHYQLTVNESANFKLIRDRIEQKSDRLVVEANKYKSEHKLITEEKEQVYADCVREWEREKKGKGLYDTDSGSDSENLDTIHLDKKDRKVLEKEIKYLTEQIIALGDLYNGYTKERSNCVKDSFDYAVLDRERNKVSVIRRVYEHKLRERERILKGERPTFDLQPEEEDSDGGYSEIDEFFEEQSFITAKIRKRRNRQLKPRKEDYNKENIERREEREERIILDNKSK